LIDFSYTPTQTGAVSINDLIDLSIGKVEVGVDLSKLMQLGDIYFDYGKYEIREDAAVQLDKIVSIMNEYPSMIIELGSHTDCRGAKDANKKLSDNRAKASADYIRSRITTPTRISGIGYGEAKLKVNCPCEGKVVSPCPEEEHAKNRRTEFIVKKVK
jgi:outer membrane protein OmpA-like peptidoglycan-associated protein